MTVEGTGADQQVWVIGGLKDLVLLTSTGSEFGGFLEDPYTTLAPTSDQVMATSLTAKWRFSSTDADGEATNVGVKTILVKRFAEVHCSKALQQTLLEMGKAVLEAFGFMAEITFSAPKRHHFTWDDAPDAGPAWVGYTGLV